MNYVFPFRDKAKIAELKALLKDSNPRDYLLFTLGINVGFRVSDLLALRVCDVWEGDKPKEMILRREKKTRKIRVVLLNDSAREAIAFFLSGRDLASDAPLFASPMTGKSITRCQAWRLVKHWCDLIGLPQEGYGTHSLRKTLGYQARMAGISTTVIMDAFQHSSEADTARYIGVGQEEVEAMYRAVCL